MTTLSQPYELRDYQQELFDKVFNSWGAGFRRLLLQLPTGRGKTVLIGVKVAKLHSSATQRLEVLTHRSFRKIFLNWLQNPKKQPFTGKFFCKKGLKC